MAYVFADKRGFDIRSEGTKNAGASNAAVTMGFKFGALVCLADMFKAVLAVVIARRLFPNLLYVAQIAGVACIVGHVFPFWLRFRGGKGFASALGMALALDWRLFVGLIPLVLLVCVLTNYLVLATASVCVALPIHSFFMTHDIVASLILAVASVLILSKHRENYKRVFNGTEPKVSAILKKLF